MTASALAGFRVGGFDDEGDEATEPVKVTCAGCGTESGWLTYRDDGGADRTAPLDVLVGWAQQHQCPTDNSAAVSGHYAGRGNA